MAGVSLVISILSAQRRVVAAKLAALLPEEELAQALTRYPLLGVSVQLKIETSDFKLDSIRRLLLDSGAELPDSCSIARLVVKGKVVKVDGYNQEAYNFTVYCDGQLIGACADTHQNNGYGNVPRDLFAVVLRDLVIQSLQQMEAKERAKVLMNEEIGILREALIAAGQPVPLLKPAEHKIEQKA